MRYLVWEKTSGRGTAVLAENETMEAAALAWYDAWRSQHGGAINMISLMVENLESGERQLFVMSCRSPTVATPVPTADEAARA